MIITIFDERFVNLLTATVVLAALLPWATCGVYLWIESLVAKRRKKDDL